MCVVCDVGVVCGCGGMFECVVGHLSLCGVGVMCGCGCGEMFKCVVYVCGYVGVLVGREGTRVCHLYTYCMLKV